LVDLLRLGISPVSRPLPTHDNTKTVKILETFMPEVGFKPTLPEFKGARIFHALDCAAIVFGTIVLCSKIIYKIT
jgi:hypothetical protein